MSGPMRQISGRRLPPLPGFPSTASMSVTPQSITSLCNDQALTVESVKHYLACNPAVMEEYVLENVDSSTLESWLQIKKHSAKMGSTFSSESILSWRSPYLIERYSETKVRHIQDQLLADIFDPTEQNRLLFEVSNVIANATKAEGFTLYLIMGGGQDLYHYLPSSEGKNPHHRLSGPIGLGSTIAAHVAFTQESLLLRDLLGDERFPQGTGVPNCSAQSAVCVPITMPSGDLLGIIELTRGWDTMAFNDIELQTATMMVSWIGTTIYENQLNKTLIKQRELNEFLLEVSKTIFTDIITIDSLISKIMEYAKSLVSAERCALFLVDEEKQELFADLFDEGKYENGKAVFEKKVPIRFPLSKGIAGHVAVTKEVVNIPDAYKDARFNRQVDLETGFTTKSILCMPIIGRGRVIGVVQMINNMKGGPFTHADETSFKMFAVYCALALHYSKIYTELERERALCKVSLETLQYHRICSDAEFHELKLKPMPSERQIPADFFKFEFWCGDHEKMLPQLAIYMFHYLFGDSCFEEDKLCRFILTLRKNYRPVSYHNWIHGFNVAHCMFVFMIALREREERFFSQLEEISIITACLAHDVDHRGYNNAFFTKMNLDMANLYSTSVMEQHHYKTTVSILQQEGHNIFCQLSREDYKEVLQTIHTAILATDLALYFPLQKRMASAVQAGTFNLHDPEHRRGTLSIMMTLCDLSGVCKLWPVQEVTVPLLYSEFHMQGDAEKEAGLQPLPMMDRDRYQEMPKEQVGFINFVCMPGYKLLAEILPESQPLLDGVQDNLVQWTRVMEGKSTGMWMQSKSRPRDK